MEYAPEGDLEFHINNDHRLSEEDTKQIGFQVLKGVRVMHAMDFVHRDIKPGVCHTHSL